jgi:sulfur relay (sulfurtransferase) DsrF/TusC family protein
MLISMPHGTSTIFGAFQAILALLAKRDELPPSPVKVPRDGKFASEFFRQGTSARFAAAQHASHRR